MREKASVYVNERLRGARRGERLEARRRKRNQRRDRERGETELQIEGLAPKKTSC